MSTTPADPLLETLVNDFGGNYVVRPRSPRAVPEGPRQRRCGLAHVLRRGHRRDAGQGDGDPEAPRTEPPAVTVIPVEAKKAESGRAPRRARACRPLARSEPQPSAGGRRSTAVARVPVLPGDILPARSAAAPCASSRTWRLSLQIPTATSVRHDPGAHARGEPAAPQQAPRGHGRDARSASPTSWPGRSCARSTPSRAERRLRGDRGPAPPHPARRGPPRASPSTCQKKDGSRTLLVPNIKDAEQARLRGAS